jgi:hypothetical protein
MKHDVAVVGNRGDMTKPLMMSCTQIAEVAKSIGEVKRHDVVLKAARAMLLKLYGGDELKREGNAYITANAVRLFEAAINLSQGEAATNLWQGASKLRHGLGAVFEIERDAQGRVSELWLDKDHATGLVSKYSDEMRMAIIRRMGELERDLAAKTLPAPAPNPWRDTEPVAIEDKTLARVSMAITCMDLLAGSKSYGLTQDEHRNGIHKLFRSHGLPVEMLPAPTDYKYSGEGSATHLLAIEGRCLPVPRFFKLLEQAGIVRKESRPSTKHKDVLKHSWRFTTEGMRYGYDERVGRSKDYTCLFYTATFNTLLRMIAPAYQRLVESGQYRPKWPKEDNAKHAEAYRGKMARGSARERAEQANATS